MESIVIPVAATPRKDHFFIVNNKKKQVRVCRYRGFAPWKAPGPSR